MFSPEDWIRKPSTSEDLNAMCINVYKKLYTNEDMRMIYINVDTRLPKLRETFSIEQQKELDRHEVKQYNMKRLR